MALTVAEMIYGDFFSPAAQGLAEQLDRELLNGLDEQKGISLGGCRSVCKPIDAGGETAPKIILTDADTSHSHCDKLIIASWRYCGRSTGYA